MALAVAGPSKGKHLNNKTSVGSSPLKLGCRSEFSKNIRTYNMAVYASMNRHLSQSLRDVHSNIEYLNRSQQATYKTMCKVSQHYLLTNLLTSLQCKSVLLLSANKTYIVFKYVLTWLLTSQMSSIVCKCRLWTAFLPSTSNSLL